MPAAFPDTASPLWPRSSDRLVVNMCSSSIGLSASHVAGALIMYDRLLTMGRHAPRPVGEGAPTEAAALPVFGDPIYKRKQRARARIPAKT